MEGGGLRGLYTAGVLRFFMDRGLYLPYVIGVSMGACNAANYVARQPERNRIVNIRYVNDSRFLSYRRLLLKGELFGMDFIFDTIPNRLVPFDYQTFKASRQRFIITATDCETGMAVYYEKDKLGDDFLTVLRAGCSLPLVQKPVRYDGRILLDGGIADPVPLRKSMEDGNTRHVLVLTQPGDYRKKASAVAGLVRMGYRRFEKLCRAIETRHIQYNQTMDKIDRLEADGAVFVIRPSEPLAVKRAERNKGRLYEVYDRGYDDARARHAGLCSYLEKGSAIDSAH